MEKPIQNPSLTALRNELNDKDIVLQVQRNLIEAQRGLIARLNKVFQQAEPVAFTHFNYHLN